MKRNFVCIVCPNGCELAADILDGQLVDVEGAACPRGIEYATNEISNPMRTISSSVVVKGGTMPLASVRLSRPVKKALIFPIMREINTLRLTAPVHIGQVVSRNVCDSGSDVIITKNVEQA